MSEEIVKSKKQFYRGVSLDDLKLLDVRELAKYLPSRSRRSVLRNFQSVEKFTAWIRRERENRYIFNAAESHLDNETKAFKNIAYFFSGKS